MTSARPSGNRPLRSTASVKSYRLAPRPLALAIHLALAGGVTFSLSAPAQAQSQAQLYQIPAGPLANTLTRFAQEAGITLAADGALTRGKTSPGLQGRHTVSEGLNRLLAESGLEATTQGNGVYSLKVKPTAADQTLPTITVKAAQDPSELPAAYAGGRIARGAQVGLLGNRDFMDTPFSVLAYTAEHIEEKNAQTLADLLASDPSIRNTTTSGHMMENFRLRGFMVDSGDIALNGMYGIAPPQHVPTEFLERAEITKGPLATFAGMAPNGGIGGMVNLVSKRAGKDQLTRLTVDYTSSSQLGTHLDVSRRFGEEKQFGARINAATRSGDTFLDGQSKSRDLLAAGLDFRGDKLNVTLDVYQSWEKFSGGTPAQFWFDSSVTHIPNAPDASLNQFKGLYGETRSEGVQLRGEYAFHDQLTAYAAVGTLNSEYTGYMTGTHVRNADASGTSTVTRTFGQRGYFYNLASEAGLRGQIETGAIRHEWVLQASQLNIKSATIRNFGSPYTTNIYDPATPVLSGIPESIPHKGNDNTFSALSLADTLHMADDKVQLTLGLRQQRVRTQGFDTTTGVQTSSYDKTVVSPAVAVVVKPWGPQWSLYANRVEGLSQGDLVPATSSATNAGYQFAPYQTVQNEVGFKWDGGRFAHTVALFQVSKPSMILEGNTYTDKGKQRNRGIEWNAFGEVSRSLRLNGGLAYTDARLLKNETASLDGKEAVGVPKWQGSLGAEWDTPWVAGLSLNATATYTSSLYLDAANTQQIPSWVRFDAGARYTTRLQDHKVVFRATVANLQNKNYWTGAFSDSTTVATLGAPRTVTLSATIDF